jgi:hypothetical protein
VRRRVDLVGEIRSTGVVSYGTGAWFTAQLHDASGSVGLVWMGRTELPGVLPGRRLRARGRLAKNRGRRVVFNPDYALEPQPDSPAGL